MRRVRISRKVVIRPSIVEDGAPIGEIAMSETTRKSSELWRFTEAMRHIMAVPKSEIEKRAKEYRKQRQRKNRKGK